MNNMKRSVTLKVSKATVDFGYHEHIHWVGEFPYKVPWRESRK